MKKPHPLFASFVLFTLFFAGCAQTVPVRVDALSRDPAPGGNPTTVPYVLVSGDPAVANDDLLFLDAARHVEEALATRGFTRVSRPNLAAQEIAMTISRSEPLQVSENFSRPVYARTLGYPYYRSVPVLDPSGKVVRLVAVRGWRYGRREFAGFVNESRQVTVYEKGLNLSARPIRSDGTRGAEVWQLDALLQDESTDLRAALPFLAAAVSAYAGDQTDGEIVLPLTEEDLSLAIAN